LDSQEGEDEEDLFQHLEKLLKKKREVITTKRREVVSSKKT